MTIGEMHTGVRLEIDKSGTLDSVGFEPIEIDYWLNAAISSLVKTKYSGSISTRGAFEQNQKRIDDLRALVEEEELAVSIGTVKPNSFTASLPSLSSTYWFSLGEEVNIAIPITTSVITSGASKLTDGSWYLAITESVNNGYTYSAGTYFLAAGTTLTSGTVYACNIVRQGVTKSTADTYRTQIDNPYSEHVLDNDLAKPLRLFRGNLIELITDGNYGITKYFIRYLKKPELVNYVTATSVASGSIQPYYKYQAITDSVTYNNVAYNANSYFYGVTGVTTFTGAGTVNLVQSDCDLSDHVHDEVVKLAANMILENIESQRYNTHSFEVRKTE